MQIIRRLASIVIILSVLLSLSDPHPAAGTVRGGPPPALVVVSQTPSEQGLAGRGTLDQQLRQRFPQKEYRWATLAADPPPAAAMAPPPPADLAQVLADLKNSGVNAVAIQPLALVPGSWEQQLAAATADTGLKIAVGQPLLSSLRDRQRLIAALANTLSAGKNQSVLLIAEGSKTPATLREYLSLHTLLLGKGKEHRIFLGTVNSLPELKSALAAVQKAAADTVTIVPLPAFLDGPIPPSVLAAAAAAEEGLKAVKTGKVEIFQEGLGSIDGVAAIYADHLAAALETLAPKKPERKKRGKK